MEMDEFYVMKLCVLTPYLFGPQNSSYIELVTKVILTGGNSKDELSRIEVHNLLRFKILSRMIILRIII